MPTGRISGINGLYTGFFLCLSMFLRFTFLREMCRNLFWEKYFFICGKDLLISARIVWILVANFLETTCYLFSNFKLIIWFFFYFRRSCRGGTSFFCWPKRRKQEKGLGIACMSASLPKRDSCCLHAPAAKGAGQLRYDRESIRPLLKEPSVSIFPLRPPPLCLSFSKKHLLDFLMAARWKIRRAVQPRYDGELSGRSRSFWAGILPGLT